MEKVRIEVRTWQDVFTGVFAGAIVEGGWVTGERCPVVQNEGGLPADFLEDYETDLEPYQVGARWYCDGFGPFGSHDLAVEFSEGRRQEKRLVDFSAYGGGEIGLGLLEFTNTGRTGHCSKFEREIIERSVVLPGGEIGRLEPKVAEVPFFLRSGSLKKSFPDCPDYVQLRENLEMIGVPDVKTLTALSRLGWREVSVMAFALREVSTPDDEALLIFSPDVDGEYNESDEDEPEIDLPAFMQAIPVTGGLTAYEKGTRPAPWESGLSRAGSFVAKDLDDLANIQRNFRSWYESRKTEKGFSSVARRFWDRYNQELARLTVPLMTDAVQGWVDRLAVIPAETLKFAGAMIGQAITGGKFTPEQGKILWRAWHKRKAELK